MSVRLWLAKNHTKSAKNEIVDPKFPPKTFFGRRKMKRRESSETRFGKVSRRSEPSSRGKRPFKVSQKFDSENFKRPKNREDSSDLDETWTESIAAPQTRFPKICSRSRCPKTSRKRSRNRRRRRGVGGMAEPLNLTRRRFFARCLR